MEYRALAEVYEKLDGESSKLGKTSIIADFIRNLSGEDLEMSILLLQGRVFPIWSDKEVGIATLLMIKAISNSTGFSAEEINGKFRESGDLGLVVEGLVEGRKQSTLFSRTLTIRHVFENLRKLADVEGKGSQNRKFRLVSELLGSADPKEAKYIVRTVLGELRIGVAEGIVRDAIAEAFFPAEGRKGIISAVEWAFFMKGDYAEVAAIAREKGLSGLRKVSVEIGRPVQVLLAEKSPSLEKALETYDNFILEFKYDGMRIQIHKKGERTWLYTRKLENVTKQFPDILRMCKEGIKARKCIVEGEVIVMDSGGRPQPFQSLSQRIQRKYDIDDVAKKMPVQVNLFDVIHLEGEDLFGKRFCERRKILEGIITEKGGVFQLARQLSTKDIKKADTFYKEALKSGHEGLIVKNLDSLYQPGRRVAGGWLKVKPTMENLDLVIMGGTWGTGKRAGWLGSLVLGCRDNGRFLQCGMIGTGIKEKGESGVTFEELTKLLKPYIESEQGSIVRIKPNVVVEVAYEEIQKSPNYDSGYALRFPRVVRLRTSDKKAEQADTLERVERLYKMQSKQRT